MRSELLTRGRGAFLLAGLLSISVAGVGAGAGFAIVACNTGDGEMTVSTTTYADGAPILASGDDAAGDDAGDDDSSAPYMGPTSGGNLTAPLPSEAGTFSTAMPVADGATDTIDSTCCNLTFVFDPATLIEDAGTAITVSSSDAGDAGDGGDAGDAGAATAPTPPFVPTAVSLVGDAYPLANGTTIAMTKANGVWTATACVPPSEYLRYRFYVGQVPFDPTDPDAGTVADFACDPNAAQVSDGMGGCYNTFGPVNACSDVDASVGMVSNDP